MWHIMTSVPHDWLCPISYEIMRDPVIAPDGYTYERGAITHWLSTNPMSPFTRVPMTVANLVPNRALQSTIEAFLVQNPTPLIPRPAPPPKSFSTAPLTTTAATFKASDGKNYLHVRVSAPPHGARQPVVLLPIIDNSGSMDELVGAAGGVEDMGFTRLDLVKHAVRTMVSILGEDDIMGIVTFSTDAKVVLTPIRMDDAGKRNINAALDSIRAEASTNIYEGIKKGAALLSDPAFEGHNIVAMLLTDGYPTINPPRGIIPSLTSVRVPNQWVLHTFGFGYNLDSSLCAELAQWGGGLFGFIPDATMVGTVFINALAHILSTAALNNTFNYQASRTATTHTINTGPITYGQPRDYLFEVQDSPLFNGDSVSISDPSYVLTHHMYKQIIRDAINICKSSNDGLRAQALLADFESRMNNHAEPFVSAMMKDLRASKEGEGQVGMAPAHFNRWGEHYMRAYLRAQELQQCMNFKDPGLQIYGGDLFHSLQDTGDRLFCDLPPPTPSRRSYGGVAAPTSMSVFHNASGGCFAPETLIRRSDDRYAVITDLKRGDSVWTPSGPATVLAVVVCGSKTRAQPMTMLDSLVITPYHPVRRHNGWQFPADIAGYCDRLISTVYNLVLDSGHIVLADGWEALTLGHGFNEPVAAHSYFGTQRVIDDLKKQPGWADGRPTYKNLKAVKDPDSGIITGWIDDI